jgi:hypothetical protein
MPASEPADRIGRTEAASRAVQAATAAEDLLNLCIVS